MGASGSIFSVNCIIGDKAERKVGGTAVAEARKDGAVAEKRDSMD